MAVRPRIEWSVSDSISETDGARRARFKVITVTGVEISLLHRQEKAIYERAQQKYQDEYTFTAANDLRALERLLLLEIQMHRAQWYMAAGMDYDGVDLDAKEESDLRRTIKDVGAQLAEAQKDLGLTKAQRDKQDVDSVGGYIVALKQRAKAHGVRREKQLGRAIELSKELFSLAGAYQRSNENERRKLGIESADDIVTWILEYMKPEFDAVDEHFRQHEQRFWVREL